MRPGSLASVLALAAGAKLDDGIRMLTRGPLQPPPRTDKGKAKVRRAARKRRNVLQNRRNHRG
jgi:hypothetical protein